MKRANFTLFQPQKWISLLGKSALMVLFAWCCLGIQNAEAQIVVEYKSNDTTCVMKKLDPCKGTPDSLSTLFTDDGNNDGNYNDLHQRRDTVEICPEDQWHYVKVVFTKFDLEDSINVFGQGQQATGDTLLVFQGDKAAIRDGNNPLAPSGSGTGTGVSRAFGGWVYAACDPDSNATGCLTFVLKTDGDNAKGAGWEAWVDCAERDIEIVPPNIRSVELTCDSSAYSIITIDTVRITGCGGDTTIADTVLLRVFNQAGELCFDTCVGGDMKITMDTFGLGIYRAEWKLKSDTMKSAEAAFSVQAPSLVCNNEIIVPFGSACMIALTPDMVLEDPCDTIPPDTMNYSFRITVNGILIASGSNPIITKEAIRAAGGDICGGTAIVEITRTYKALTTICNNGAQSQKCPTIIRFKDETAPIFTSTRSGIDTLVACNADSIITFLSPPTAIDNCDSMKVGHVVSGDLDFSDVCVASRLIIIKYFATDECGNTSDTLPDSIRVLRPRLSEVSKVADDTLECKSNADSDKLPVLETGVIVNGVFTKKGEEKLNTTDYVWGYILTKKDVNIPSPDCGRKVFRYWSVLNWCTPAGGPSPVDTQFIHYTDTKAPYFTYTGADTLESAATKIDLGPFECTTELKTTTPQAKDDCDDDPTEKMFKVEQKKDGKYEEIGKNLGETGKLVCDTFKISWRAYDDCHTQLKEDTVCRYFIIRDVTKPSAVCTDELIVSVPSDNGARIHAKDVDGGSTDACKIDTILIRRKNTTDPWKSYVDIVCTDVHGDPVLIEMRVWDKKGLYNTCWMAVTAEDKIAPHCDPIPDLTFTCDQFHNDELGSDTKGEFVVLPDSLYNLYNNKFGDPDSKCYDNLTCVGLTVKQYFKLTELNCGALEIERKWTATDWNEKNKSNEGTQKIHVIYKPEWTLKFPKDEDVRCNGVFPDAYTAAQIISNGSCDLFALEVTDKTFIVPGDICMKIERTYELINWCVYTAGAPATVIAHNANGTEVSYQGNETVGRFTYVQVLKLYVDEAPSLEIAEVDSCITAVDGDAKPYGMADDSPGEAPYECDEIKTFSATGKNCADIALGTDAFTWKFYVNGDLKDSGKGYKFDKVVEPKTKYKVEFWVEDGCGNSTGAYKEYEFWDCVKPTPYVLNGIAIEIMQTGEIQVWANDLDQGSYDNCTPKDKIKQELRIRKGDPADGPQDYAGVYALDKNVTFTCSELGTQSVSIYAIDEEKKWDVVGTYVLIQAHNGACDVVEINRGMVAGKIQNLGGELIEQVKVSVNGGSDKTMTTGAEGKFQFNLTKGGDYTITPEKNVNPLNGVSTYDLVLISKHILGIELFDSPYKFIAADVNKSGAITAFDMVQLRQLILNITSEFPNNASWRFIDAKYQFTTNNPSAENFDEFMSINNLDGNRLDVDFVAAKIGDVNGNALANNLLGADVRNTNGTLNLNVTDQFVEVGQTINIDFTSADIATVQGYQFTMNFAGLELSEVVEGVAKTSNFNTKLAERGVLTTSWNGEAAATDVLFSLTFKANTTGLLSEILSLNSDLTLAEAYDNAGELMDVKINFNSSNVSAAFGLNQNTPNPFNGETVIGFNLPQAGAATLKVMDVQGKVLRSIEGNYAKGYNEVTINAKTLSATGVLYYQLESSDNVATKKMIIIE